MVIDKIPIVILAAGSSSRLGQPKQLVPYGTQTLLSYAIEQALAAGLGQVIVVLGARETEIRKTIKGAVTISNEHWQEGMGSSIVAGVNYVKEAWGKVNGMMLLLCDQPYVNAELIQQVAKEGREKGIAVCDYGTGKGPPAYFSSDYFDELLLLKGDQGAKALIQKYSEKVRYLSFPKGQYDIDTEEDLKILKP